MVRVGVPGGVLTAEQYLMLDRLADLGDGSLRITTRQDIQYHRVPKSRARELIRAGHLGRVSSVRMSVYRNVMPGFGTPPEGTIRGARESSAGPGPGCSSLSRIQCTACAVAGDGRYGRSSLRHEAIGRAMTAARIRPARDIGRPLSPGRPPRGRDARHAEVVEDSADLVPLARQDRVDLVLQRLVPLADAHGDVEGHRQRGRLRRIMVVALARKLLIALWRYLETGLVPQGATLRV